MSVKRLVISKNHNRILRRFALAMVFLFPQSLFANFDFNANCLKAYEQIFELKLNNARQLLQAEKKANPGNGIVVMLENYIDYFYLLTSDSKVDFDRLQQNKSKRLETIEACDKNSPYYLYAQAEINLQWALIRGRYGEYVTAAREIRKAKVQLQENTKKYPGFHLNAKGLGLINAFLGNLPEGMLKSTLGTFGIKGNLEVGVAMLDRLATNLPQSKYAVFYDEVVFYYVFVLNDIAHSKHAYVKTMKYTARISDSSLLKTYLQALVCSKNAHNDEAIDILENRPQGSAYQAFPYLSFLSGVVKLNKLDYSSAADFHLFLQENKGVNYIKDAYLHLAWNALLKDGTGAYSAQISKVKSQGHIYQEKDKQALNEADAPAPDRQLLKARLLYDGGYYQKSLDLLKGHRGADFSEGRDKAEYYYRLGRINGELGKEDDALVAYQNAISLGKNLRYYYAANSALQIGKILAARKDTAKATVFFNLAIQMKNHDYESSIETQAKAGLRKL